MFGFLSLTSTHLLLLAHLDVLDLVEEEVHYKLFRDLGIGGASDCFGARELPEMRHKHAKTHTTKLGLAAGDAP